MKTRVFTSPALHLRLVRAADRACRRRPSRGLPPGPSGRSNESEGAREGATGSKRRSSAAQRRRSTSTRSRRSSVAKRSRSKRISSATTPKAPRRSRSRSSSTARKSGSVTKTYEKDANARYEGVLKNLENAIDKLQLGNAGPPGSKGIVISYSQGAEIKVADGRPEEHHRWLARKSEGLHRQDRHRHGPRASRWRSPSCKRSQPRARPSSWIGDGNDTNNDACEDPARTAQEGSGEREDPTSSRSSTSLPSPTIATSSRR